MKDRKPLDPLREAVVPQKQEPNGRCIFCGEYTFGRVCRSHRDLLEIEDDQRRRVRR